MFRRKKPESNAPPGIGGGSRAKQTRAEKQAEAAQKAAENIDNTKESLSDAKDELTEINNKIDALLSKDALTFVEEKDLQNLREQKALLEDELNLKQKILEEDNQKYLNKKEAAYDKAKKDYDKGDFYDTDIRWVRVADEEDIKWYEEVNNG